MPYQSLGESSGALAVMALWSRSAMSRSDGVSSAILAIIAFSSSSFPPPRRAALTSSARSFMASRSSAVNAGAVFLAVAFFAVFFAVVFFAVWAIGPLLRESRRYALTVGERRAAVLLEN